MVASPCSAVEIATDTLEEKDGRCWSRGVENEIEDDREFMVSFAVDTYFTNYLVSRLFGTMLLNTLKP